MPIITSVIKLGDLKMREMLGKIWKRSVLEEQNEERSNKKLSVKNSEVQLMSSCFLTLCAT